MTTTKLYAAKRRNDTRLIHALINDLADRNLGKAITLYTDMLGRPVSHSLVVRRALDLLVSHLAGLNSEKRVEAEKATLVNHIR